MNNQSREVMEWRVHTPGLLKEIIINPQCSMLGKPLQIFAELLNQIAERSSQLNDPILNGLMCQLALYEIADPCSADYDHIIVEQLIAEKQQKLKGEENHV